MPKFPLGLLWTFDPLSDAHMHQCKGWFCQYKHHQWILWRNLWQLHFLRDLWSGHEMDNCSTLLCCNVLDHWRAFGWLSSAGNFSLLLFLLSSSSSSSQVYGSTFEWLPLSCDSRLKKSSILSSTSQSKFCSCCAWHACHIFSISLLVKPFTAFQYPGEFCF